MNFPPFNLSPFGLLRLVPFWTPSTCLLLDSFPFNLFPFGLFPIFLCFRTSYWSLGINQLVCKPHFVYLWWKWDQNGWIHLGEITNGNILCLVRNSSKHNLMVMGTVAHLRVVALVMHKCDLKGLHGPLDPSLCGFTAVKLSATIHDYWLTRPFSSHLNAPLLTSLVNATVQK